MLEMYGFIAAFTAQILIFSVLGPLRLVDGLRDQIEEFIAERAPPVERICISAGIVCVVALWLNFALVMLDQQRWEPTFGSVSLIVIGLLTRMALKEQMRIPERPGPATALTG